jgi:hypothetical protein
MSKRKQATPIETQPEKPAAGISIDRVVEMQDFPVGDRLIS